MKEDKSQPITTEIQSIRGVSEETTMKNYTPTN